MKTLNQKTPEEIYLEFLCDFISVKDMAQEYGMKENEMLIIIDKASSETYRNQNKVKV